MDAPRRRFESLVEWVIAGACTAGAVALVSMAVDERGDVRSVVPAAIANEASAAAAVAGIPPGVVSVPLLLLGDRREVRLGEQLANVAARLGAPTQLVSESVDDMRNGRRRITRVYNDVGVQFILVFDAVERSLDPRLSAIFIR